MFSYSLSLSLFYLYRPVSMSFFSLLISVSLSLCVCIFFSLSLLAKKYSGSPSINIFLPFFLSLPLCLSLCLSHSYLCHPTYLASNISVSLYPNLTIFCILLYLTYYFQLSLFHTASPSLCLFFSLVLFIGSFRVQIRK